VKHLGLTINLKDDPKVIAAYKEYHRNLWPEVEASLRRAGINRSRIFILGRRLFMYMEIADDCDGATYVARYLEEPKAVEWEKLMAPLFEVLPEAKPDETWAMMEPIFELN
jgi:L-rhamnose mutarotase